MLRLLIAFAMLSPFLRAAPLTVCELVHHKDRYLEQDVVVSAMVVRGVHFPYAEPVKVCERADIRLAGNLNDTAFRQFSTARQAPAILSGRLSTSRYRLRDANSPPYLVLIVRTADYRAAQSAK